MDQSVSKLKILDLSQNVLQIGILHQFRTFLENNTELNALSISGIHLFNERAFKSIMKSLQINTGVQTIELGNLL